MLLRKIASLFLASYAKRKIVLNQETIKADARIVFERLKLVKVPTENLVDVKRVRNKIYYDENIESLELQKMINIYCKAIIKIYYFLVQDGEILKTKKQELSYILGSNVVSDENIKKLIEFRNKNILRLV